MTAIAEGADIRRRGSVHCLRARRSRSTNNPSIFGIASEMRLMINSAPIQGAPHGKRNN